MASNAKRRSGGKTGAATSAKLGGKKGDRSPDGRFAPGCNSANPNGRPLKAKFDHFDILLKVLSEVITSNQSGFPRGMTKLEALIQSAFVHGLKNPHIALNLLKMAFGARAQTDDGVGEAKVEEADEIFARLLERKIRQHNVDGDNDNNDENDEPTS